MRIYYDVQLRNEKKNRTVKYWADGFSIDSSRKLKIKSEECGDVVVMVEIDEKVTVNEVRVAEEWDNDEWDNR